MEYWSVEIKDVNPLAITPTLQYSNTPKFKVELISSSVSKQPYRQRLFLFGLIDI
jgi:hypothetical protein